MEPTPSLLTTSSALHFARWLIGLMAVGVALTSVDMAFHILPAYPALQPVRHGPLPWQLAYVACAPIGLGVLLLVRRRPLLAFGLSLVLPMLFWLARIYLWKQLGWMAYLMPIVPFLIAHEVFGTRRRGGGAQTDR